ncbi:hypothetical protein K3G63_14900 [Hymenobacter sp. HSC-4F20]|uniref:hypothetical protein n=1 Tax=Hymenobacter sp. HSC-4F20 TaxID=2864135 RepID=UPI001C73C4B9|nr:hypothetical protein [Hymenobacter sp. HSC-4F20]MBX0291737.1 hypothetical protein [Hymenobacter sp. HSC-4F20]
MLPAAPEFIEVAYRTDLDVLLIRWMRKVELEEMCRGYFYLLEVAAHHQCRYWLLDARRRFNTDREGAQWMVATFLPQLRARLGGRAYLAYLLAPVTLRDAEADAAFPAASFFQDKPYTAERFVDERLAIQWLQEGQQLLA